MDKTYYFTRQIGNNLFRFKQYYLDYPRKIIKQKKHGSIYSNTVHQLMAHKADYGISDILPMILQDDEKLDYY